MRCSFHDRPPHPGGGVFAVVSHDVGGTTPVLGPVGPHLGIAVPSAVPGRAGPVEVWRSDRPVEVGEDDDGLVHAADGRYLFAATRIRHDDEYSPAVEKAYLRILDLADGLGYEHVARMWNVVGGITAPAGPDLDRYRVFCAARGQAFERRGIIAGAMPAATGIGGHDGWTSVYLLATRSSVVRVENPLQVSAFDYPERYGAVSPSFARATVVRHGDGTGEIFVSGTASIAGHETVHRGDVTAQTATTLDTIAELVSGTNLRAHGIDAGLALHDLGAVKVYVKRPADVGTVAARCAEAFGDGAEVLLTIADVCRDDLLVEIEAFAPLPTR